MKRRQECARRRMRKVVGIDRRCATFLRETSRVIYGVVFLVVMDERAEYRLRQGRDLEIIVADRKRE